MRVSIKDCFLSEQLVQKDLAMGKGKQKYICLTFSSKLFWITVVPWHFTVVLFPVSAFSVSISEVRKTYGVGPAFRSMSQDIVVQDLFSNKTPVKMTLPVVLSLIST